MILLLFISIITFFVINLLDGSTSSLFASIIVYIIGFFYSFNVEREKRSYSSKLFFVVYTIYLISAYIFSLSFQKGHHFLLIDPLTYLQEFSSVRDNSIEFYLQYFKDCYFLLTDNNALYNAYVRLSALFANTFLDGGSVLYATLLNTLFGILSSTVLYRILLIYFSPKKAYKYVLYFSILSLFHFYSVVIVRDIIIAFFYLLVIEIVLKKYSTKNLIKLLVLLLIVWGIRLYSGLFIIIFILYYVYVPLRNSKFKPIILPLYILLLIFLVITSSVVVEQSLEEIKLYQEFSIEKGEVSGGLSNYLLNLPFGIKQVALTIYSQFHPFPPYAPLLSAATFSQYYMSVLTFIYSVWWAFVFFPLLLFSFLKGGLKKMPIEFKLLFGIAIIFIMANTAHIDIRRMMPVYPIIYIIFLNVKDYIIPRKTYRRINNLILFLFLLFSAIYLFLIG